MRSTDSRQTQMLLLCVQYVRRPSAKNELTWSKMSENHNCVQIGKRSRYPITINAQGRIVKLCVREHHHFRILKSQGAESCFLLPSALTSAHAVNFPVWHRSMDGYTESLCCYIGNGSSWAIFGVFVQLGRFSFRQIAGGIIIHLFDVDGVIAVSRIY